ncbi:MAG: flagellum-specific ATP synthase FliI, partial [Rickettsiales bacterium]|nr:flagellum-specific ATP synthase FliI [Rickettsiales bacterium]
MSHLHDKIRSQLSQVKATHFYGRVKSVRGLLVECEGIHKVVSVGSRCIIYSRDNKEIYSEVVGVSDTITTLMPFTEPDGIGVDCRVKLMQNQSAIFPHASWLGRVVNAFGEPIDDKGPLTIGDKAYLLKSQPPPAHKRQRVGDKIDLGVRAVNTFITCCKGQRLGIFAGSGVGKSMLISMLTKYSETDIKIIGLIGERGREVQEFIQEYLGEEGLKKAIIVVATSDESALMRVQAAYTTMAIAEYYRDLDQNVLCLMDSVTRFAMAYREIGLSAGQPPPSKGYPPRVYAELPKLLERAGPGEGNGTITRLFSLLVEG